MVRTRIAPTPSGALHLGTTHAAMFNYLFARRSGGQFILRIDDSDPKRSKKEYEENIMASLKWLGLDWDEGPDIGGPYAPYRQSERMDHYWPYVEKLLKENKAYFCYCTTEELDAERKQLEAEKKPIKYSGKCRKLTREQQVRYEKEGRKPTVRLRVPEKEVSFIDPARGKVTNDAALFGDYIIARSDKTALLIVATTVDDIEMKITHAIRGEDYINFVPKQIILFEALGAVPPVFAHIPFVYAADGSKLSKRHDAASVSDYKKLGYLPDAIFNYLLLLGWTPPDENEIISKEKAIKIFALEKLSVNNHRFNIDKLNWINGEYIRRMTDQQLAEQIFDFYEKKLNKEIISITAPLVKERIKKLSDYLPLTAFMFNKPDTYEIDLSAKRDLILSIAKELEQLQDWTVQTIGETLVGLAKKLGLKNSEFFMVLRIAMTGKKISPPLNESMQILGKEKVLSYLLRASEPRQS